MALFQKVVLNGYLKLQDQELVEKSYRKFTRYFHNPTIQENIRKSKEEQFQEGFLRELFVNILGYTLNPKPQFNLTTEFKNEKGANKVDGAILKEGRAIGVIELKGTKTKDLESIRKQAFDYKANQAGCVYVITSNFEKLRFYINDAVEFEEFNLFRLSLEEFALLHLCLHSNNILVNQPFEIKSESIREEEKITKKFYVNYSFFKRELFRDLVKLNMKNQVFRNELNNEDSDRANKNIKRSLFSKSQKLIDRFLFIFFAEDRSLLPPNSTLKILKNWDQLNDLDAVMPLYDRYKLYFKYLDQGRAGTEKRAQIFAYNGGLFKPDPVLDSLHISDDLLYRHTKILSNYNFQSQVGVNILGHIFENSLNEIESINAEIEETDFDKQKTKRKKDGVFYTPKYITKYIVDNTIGKLCDQKKTELKIIEEDFHPKRQKETKKKLIATLEDYREWLLQLTILDPACGSGAFLNQALDFLIKEHGYLDELQTNLLGGGFVFPNIENTVLENNIFGVDLNEESVEIAKLSLWLRTAQPRRKLNDLSSNIKCGNSLIDSKIVAGDKAFQWEEEFPEIFEKGGFDVVIGNPPYVDIKGLGNEIVKYLFQTFKSANNRVNLYSSFIEKSVTLMNEEGLFSFIIPSSLLTQDSYKELRQLLLNETTIENIVRLPNESFGGSAGEVKVDTIILTFKSGIQKNAETEIIVYKGFDRINEISNYNSDIHFTVNPFDWKKDKNFLFRINSDNSVAEILSKCQIDTKNLIGCAEFCLGLTPYDKYKGHSPEQIQNRVFHSDQRKDDSFKKLLAGNDITRYNVSWGGEEWISYGDWLGAPREKKFFCDKRILVKQIIDWTDKRIWAALTQEEFYNTQNAFNLIPRDDYKAEYLIAIVNSRLMSFYHRKQFLEEFKDRFQKILIKDAKEFPIKIIHIDEQKKYVKKVREIEVQTIEFKKITSIFSKYVSSQFALKKLSRKLENWHKLEFVEFIKELNKVIKKGAGEKLSKMDEIEWMEVFNTKKAEVLNLKSEIDNTDKEIDQMVYQLYRLTDEEIAIVESS